MRRLASNGNGTSHMDSIASICALKLGNTTHLFSGSRDTSIRQWDVESGQLEHDYGRGNDWIQSVKSCTQLNIEGGMLMSACRSGEVALWTLANEEKYLEGTEA